MARIRSVHPKICESEDLVTLPAEVERTYVRLWTHCDDEGRAKDNALLIKAAIYPLHEDMTAEVVDRHLSVLAVRGLLRRYNVDGIRYLAVVKWSEYQHPQKKRESLLPPPPETPDVGVRDEGDSPTGILAESRDEPVTSGFTSPVALPDEHGPVVGEGEVVVVGEGEWAPQAAQPLAGRLSEPRHFVELVDPGGPVAVRREAHAILEAANRQSDKPLTPSETAKVRPAIKEALDAGYDPAELAAAIASAPYKTGPSIMGELRLRKRPAQRRESVGDAGLHATDEWLRSREGA